MTFAEKIIDFNQHLTFIAPLPPSIGVMNPFRENSEALAISSAFYRKFYSDQQRRKLILGINPGRLGGGATGVPFTDPKRLRSHCGIACHMHLHEPSSAFIYEMIDAYGGPKAFYQRYYISSVCPLGFVKVDAQGRETNYNYYDSKALTLAITPFVVDTLRTQLTFGIDTKAVFCLGTGKNYQFLKALNHKYSFFEEVIPLEHPRYVMQYKSKTKDRYIAKYLQALQ